METAGTHAKALMTDLDRTEYTTPRLTDTIISVWRPASAVEVRY